MKCYYCQQEIKPSEVATVAQKFFSDGGQVWDEKNENHRTYLCHVRCDRAYMRKHPKKKVLA